VGVLAVPYDRSAVLFSASEMSRSLRQGRFQLAVAPWPTSCPRARSPQLTPGRPLTGRCTCRRAATLHRPGTNRNWLQNRSHKHGRRRVSPLQPCANRTASGSTPRSPRPGGHQCTTHHPAADAPVKSHVGSCGHEPAAFVTSGYVVMLTQLAAAGNPLRDAAVLPLPSDERPYLSPFGQGLRCQALTLCVWHLGSNERNSASNHLCSPFRVTTTVHCQ
jgi:hypothetical protein